MEEKLPKEISPKEAYELAMDGLRNYERKWDEFRKREAKEMYSLEDIGASKEEK